MEGFTERHDKAHETGEAALVREKRLKHYKRDWGTKPTEADNPQWDDLFERICG